MLQTKWLLIDAGTEDSNTTLAVPPPLTQPSILAPSQKFDYVKIAIIIINFGQTVAAWMRNVFACGCFYHFFLFLFHISPSISLLRGYTTEMYVQILVVNIADIVIVL